MNYDALHVMRNFPPKTNCSHISKRQITASILGMVNQRSLHWINQTQEKRNNFKAWIVNIKFSHKINKKIKNLIFVWDFSLFIILSNNYKILPFVNGGKQQKNYQLHLTDVNIFILFFFVQNI